MGIFNFFKKNKPESIIDFTVKDLKKGYILDYFLKTWEVKNVYIYDWGNTSFSKEYFLDSGDESCYLYAEEDDEVICSIWNKIEVVAVLPNLIESITSTDEAPNTISYNNATFVKISSSLGHCMEAGDEEGYEELINWTYQNSDNKELISVNRVGEEEFEVAHGNYVKEFEFSNILPR